MKLLSKFLQHPLFKIFLSPLACVSFGSIYGASHANEFKLILFLVLSVMMILIHLIDHLLYQRLLRQLSQSTSTPLLIIFEIINLAGLIFISLNTAWPISVLLLFYIIMIHLQYWPIIFVNSVWRIILITFFHGLILNIVAYYIQTSYLTSEVINRLLPIILCYSLMELFMTIKRQEMLHIKPILQQNKISIIIVLFLMVNIGIGLYLSLPSQSYFIMQIIHAIVNIFLYIPLIIKVTNPYKQQNMLNYCAALLLIHHLLYAISIIY